VSPGVSWFTDEYVIEVASCDKGKSERECTRDMLVKVVPADDDVTHFDVQQIGRSKTPKVEGDLA
jgi:hypothetical protein